MRTIQEAKLIAIIRLPDAAQVAPCINSLVKGGIKVLEITSNTPSFAKEITRAREAHPSILIGAGTITSVALAHEAIAAGAQFLVTPNVDQDIITVAHQHNIPILMGAMTPSEIQRAIQFGADAIKLFPAGSLGIDYFKSILGPFKGTPFFAVGGIGEDNMAQWLASGIAGLGMGSKLCKPILNASDANDVKAFAIKILAQINEHSH